MPPLSVISLVVLGGIVGTRDSPSLSTGCGSPALRWCMLVRGSTQTSSSHCELYPLCGYTVFLSVDGSTRVGIFFPDLSLFKRNPGWHQLKVLCAATWCLMFSLHGCHRGGAGWPLSSGNHTAPDNVERTDEGEAETYLESRQRLGWEQERRVETMEIETSRCQGFKGQSHSRVGRCLETWSDCRICISLEFLEITQSQRVLPQSLWLGSC